jgi:hypothetical protein
VLAETATEAQDPLSGIHPPECLKDAHLAAVTSALLMRALEGIASGAYLAAEEDLRGSLEQAAQVLALIGMQYWEQTTTPAARP